ncbi:hypothetical protein KC717_03870 [Candidatus Dojkabacteria bacterium]|uniref:Uncharacterized protein n=1 Tax=Candidatus Dojkabacteria bacterium TaxID=2099670 RepID=A0A955L865_9BACT|nr:hypothetical protein [Candidatus Dojkabacteria bacterium]
MKNYIFIIPFIAFFLVGCTLLPANENATTVQPADQPSTTIIEDNPSNTVPSVIHTDSGYQDVEIEYTTAAMGYFVEKVFSFNIPAEWNYSHDSQEDGEGFDCLQIIVEDPREIVRLYFEGSCYYSGPKELTSLPSEYEIIDRKTPQIIQNNLLLRSSVSGLNFNYISVWEEENNLDPANAEYSIPYFWENGWEDGSTFYTHIESNSQLSPENELFSVLDTIVASAYVKDIKQTGIEIPGAFQ